MLCGIAIAAGAFLSWVNARRARPAAGITHTSITGLFHWSYQHSGSLTSLGVVVAAAGALVFIGGLVASRLLAGLFALIALAASGAWIGLDASHYHTTNLPYSDLRLGAWLALGGALIGLISSFFLRRRTQGMIY
jgi:hypothetical protein